MGLQPCHYWKSSGLCGKPNTQTNWTDQTKRQNPRTTPYLLSHIAKMEEPAIEEGDNHRDVEVAPALISVHPDHKFIVVSIGSDLRVFDLQ